MIFKRIALDDHSLQKYINLFKKCFPDSTHFNFEYLSWLYRNNPDGHVLGYDAYEGEELAAHYACIPTKIVLDHKIHSALLSLNTATSPNFQGQGLFSKLAAMTYSTAKEEGYSCIYGVANANSTHGFTKKLGFKLIMPLYASVGIGTVRLDWKHINSNTNFKRYWTKASLEWRSSNPNNPFKVVQKENNLLSVQANPTYKIIVPYSEISENISFSKQVESVKSPLKLFIGAIPGRKDPFVLSFSIPIRLRPSPLNFIFKSLLDEEIELNKDNISFGFFDFDAF